MEGQIDTNKLFLRFLIIVELCKLVKLRNNGDAVSSCRAIDIGGVSNLKGNFFRGKRDGASVLGPRGLTN
jgi:hypothetical protein